jgi:hypothetical protein
MEKDDSKSNHQRGLNGHPPVLFQIVVDHNPAKPSRDSDLAFSVVTDLVKQGIKEAIADADQLLDYPELAKRLRLGVRATKDLVNCGKITPALRYANVARFHWPSVLQELKKHPLR